MIETTASFYPDYYLDNFSKSLIKRSEGPEY